MHCVFVDREKAYDRVLRQKQWYYTRLSGVAEKYVRGLQYINEDRKTAMRYRCE